MEYNFLSPNCGLKVSELCLGTMTFREDSHSGTVRILGFVYHCYHYISRGRERKVRLDLLTPYSLSERTLT